MKIFYHLETCSTCQRILKALNLPQDVRKREIKSSPLNEEEVDRLAAKSGSYAAIFSKRAMKFRALGLHEKTLSEQDYRHYLLEDYTFLKRPVLETNHQVVAGNTKNAVEQMTVLLDP
jgi:arsenate reductase-like glutaredoxin family protein